MPAARRGDGLAARGAALAAGAVCPPGADARAGGQPAGLAAQHAQGKAAPGPRGAAPPARPPGVDRPRPTGAGLGHCSRTGRPRRLDGAAGGAVCARHGERVCRRRLGAGPGQGRDADAVLDTHESPAGGPARRRPDRRRDRLPASRGSTSPGRTSQGCRCPPRPARRPVATGGAGPAGDGPLPHSRRSLQRPHDTGLLGRRQGAVLGGRWRPAPLGQQHRAADSRLSHRRPARPRCRPLARPAAGRHRRVPVRQGRRADRGRRPHP